MLPYIYKIYYIFENFKQLKAFHILEKYTYYYYLVL